ncbi:MAG: hypothetical protein ACK4HE_02490 [Chitinophagaceae bacterium]
MKRTLKPIGFAIGAVIVLLNVVVIMYACKYTYFCDSALIQPKVGTEQLSSFDRFTKMVTGIKAYKRPIVDSFLLPHQSFTVRTTDGEALAVWYGARPQPRGIVLLFHGHGGNRAGVIAEATALYELGYRVLLTDFRAHGASTGNACTIGYRESEDVYTMYTWAQQFNQPIVLYFVRGCGYNQSHIQPCQCATLESYSRYAFCLFERCYQGQVAFDAITRRTDGNHACFWGKCSTWLWAFDLQPKTYVTVIHCPGANKIIGWLCTKPMPFLLT